MRMRQDIKPIEAWKFVVGVLVQNGVSPMLAVEWIIGRVESMEEKELKDIEMSVDSHHKLSDELNALSWHFTDPADAARLRAWVEEMEARRKLSPPDEAS